ncbi:hypothetical protein WDW89_20820 [Deltaproteobacteria bacterium TL4]
MRQVIIFGLIIIGGIFVGCVEDPPKYGVKGLNFTDNNFALGTLSGTLKIQRAIDESDIDSYEVELNIDRGYSESIYIASLPKAGQDLSYNFSNFHLPDYYRVDQKTLDYLKWRDRPR